jgi:NADH-quinone oxidoreductase subunit L
VAAIDLRRVLQRVAAQLVHWLTILGVAASFGLSATWPARSSCTAPRPINDTVYQWLVSDGVGMQVGFLVDSSPR